MFNTPCEYVSNKGVRCGETKTLRIMEDFRKFYEGKMSEVDAIAGGDCAQVSISFIHRYVCFFASLFLFYIYLRYVWHSHVYVLKINWAVSTFL